MNATNGNEDEAPRDDVTRYATIVADPGSGEFYPRSREFLDQADVARERVHHVDVVDDLTIAGLYELHGDPDRIRAGIRDVRHALTYAVAGTEPVFCYLHEEATGPAQTLLAMLQSAPAVVDWPFEHRSDGTLRLTVIGTDDAIRRTYEVLDDTFDLSLVETGRYHPELGTLTSVLTDRQHDILRTAVDLGYYQVPRHATHEEVADECGVSQSTVAEHLQKIESAVLPHIVR